MGGVVCLIIIRGNKTQANAQSLCQLGTDTYDGQEVMTDAPAVALATQLMEDFNQKSDALLAAIVKNP